ncbi:hypothetical protein DOTSEDRAFT_23431 [Dothistroma septosporum NZE10]|uniref:Uncharacterized protein n=1 Tax=Dothistroma septosporum (strain NZE10 / CBS 128990) TaxID=675120 RepID=N1PSG8_DOTSN|nr:hypothetical protein DOTSEDRAFT_23431 [Dothistroma septosporum NZE10]
MDVIVSMPNATWFRFREPAYVRALPQEVRYQILNYSLFTRIDDEDEVIDGSFLTSMLDDVYFSKDILDEFRAECLSRSGWQILFTQVEDLIRLAATLEQYFGEDGVCTCLRYVILDLSASYAELRSPQNEHISHVLKSLLSILPHLKKPVIRIHLRFLDYLDTAAFEDFLYYRIYEKNAMPSLEGLEFAITAGQLQAEGSQHINGAWKHHTHPWATITRFPDAYGRFIQDAVSVASVPAFVVAVSDSCDAHTFGAITSSPGKNLLLSDVEALVAHWAGDQDWPVTTAGGTITGHIPGAFNGVAAADGAIIGHQDFIDLLKEYISRFAKGETVAGDGRVAIGAAGEVLCGTEPGSVKINVGGTIAST